MANIIFDRVTCLLLAGHAHPACDLPRERRPWHFWSNRQAV